MDPEERAALGQAIVALGRVAQVGVPEALERVAQVGVPEALERGVDW